MLKLEGNKPSVPVVTTAATTAAPAALATGTGSTEELTGLAKWQADNQRLSTKIWNPHERCKKLLERLTEDPYSVSFYEPVDTDEYDDYLDVIDTPMCLEVIQQKLDRGEYKGFNFVYKFLNDIRTIWRNCKGYNLYKSQIWYSAHVLSMMTERLYQSWLVSTRAFYTRHPRFLIRCFPVVFFPLP